MIILATSSNHLIIFFFSSFYFSFACNDSQRRIGDIGCAGDGDHLSDNGQRCIERGRGDSWICHELDALRSLPSGTYTILAMDLLPSGAVPWSRMCPWV